MQAQARLGDILGDDFSENPDYAEAYYWLRLAVAQGDRVSQVELRRVERKLTPDQLKLAKRKADRAVANQKNTTLKKN